MTIFDSLHKPGTSFPNKLCCLLKQTSYALFRIATKAFDFVKYNWLTSSSPLYYGLIDKAFVISSDFNNGFYFL